MTMTLSKWSAAIFDRHRRAGVTPNPAAHELVRQTASGIRRQYAARGDRPRTPRAPLLTDDVMLLVTTAREQAHSWSEQVYERRDSALLLMGFAAALRRSELSDLTGADVELHPAVACMFMLGNRRLTSWARARCTHCRARKILAGVHPARTCFGPRWFRCSTVEARVRWSDCSPMPLSSGTGTCAAAARRRFPGAHRCSARCCAAATSLPGPLSGAGVHAVIRRRAVRAGFEPEVVERLGGHSLRAGFVTQAARAGADHHSIMRQTGHKTPAMVTRYVRESAPLIGNAVTKIGL